MGSSARPRCSRLPTPFRTRVLGTVLGTALNPRPGQATPHPGYEARKPAKRAGFRFEVSDGTRTRDRLDHNQELYRLSYAHRGPPGRWIGRRRSECSSGSGSRWRPQRCRVTRRFRRCGGPVDPWTRASKTAFDPRRARRSARRYGRSTARTSRDGASDARTVSRATVSGVPRGAFKPRRRGSARGVRGERSPCTTPSMPLGAEVRAARCVAGRWCV
jgi:hypothetical protein